MFSPVGDYMIVEIWEDVSSKIVTPDSVGAKQSDTFVIKEMGKGIMLDNGDFFKHEMKSGDRVCIVGKLLKIPASSGEFIIARMSDVIAVEKNEPIPEKI